MGNVIVRNQGTITGYYFNYISGTWTLIGTANNVGNNDTNYSISASSNDNSFAKQDVTVAFDNFTINQGRLVGKLCAYKNMPSKIALNISPTVISPLRTSILQATVMDAKNNQIIGENVSFAITVNNSGGRLGSSYATTDINGQATVVYMAGMTSGTDSLKVSVKNGNLIGKTEINIDPGATRVGGITLLTGATNVIADGMSIVAIRAIVYDTDGNFAVGLPVSFSTSAGTLSGGVSLTDISGIAEIALTSPPSIGKATLTGNVHGFSSSTSVSFIAGAPARIMLQATPSTISQNAMSLLQATVLDAYRNPVQDEAVLFDIVSNRTGGYLNSVIAITDTNGRATVNYTAGGKNGKDGIRAHLLRFP